MSAAAVRRLTDDAAGAAGQLSGSTALADGLVNLVALDGIAEAFGVRWETKRGQVYEHVQRVLDRTLGTTAYCMRVSDTDFLVVQPESRPYAARAVCYRALHEIWQHFLGVQPFLDQTIHRVTSLTEREITAIPLDPQAIMVAEAAELDVAKRAILPSGSSTMSPDQWTPFVATDGRSVRVSCQLEPVIALRTNTRMAFRLRRRVLDNSTGKVLTADEVARLSRADVLRIDLATIARGVTRLSAHEAARDVLSLIIPLSYTSLSNRSSREALSLALDHVRPMLRAGIICEIYGLDGVPSGGLVEAVALIKPMCLLVAGHLECALPSRSLAFSGLQALSVERPAQLIKEAEFTSWLVNLVAAARPITKSVMVYGCASARQMAIAASVGVTHCSGALQ